MVCTSSFGKGWEGSGIRQERGGGATLSIFPDVNELFTTVKCGGGGALLKDGDCRASSLYELIFLLTYFCPRRVNYQTVRIATGTCWTVNEDPSLCVYFYGVYNRWLFKQEESNRSLRMRLWTFLVFIPLCASSTGECAPLRTLRTHFVKLWMNLVALVFFFLGSIISSSSRALWVHTFYGEMLKELESNLQQDNAGCADVPVIMLQTSKLFIYTMQTYTINYIAVYFPSFYCTYY